MPQPPLESGYPENSVLIDLPLAEEIRIKGLDLNVAMAKRKTVRKYSSEHLNIEELAYLLWYTQGVKKITSRHVTLRTVPSAGARHAFETFLLVHKIKGLKPGIYKYVALEHKLMIVDLRPGLAEKVSQSAANQVFIIDSAATFI